MTSFCGKVTAVDSSNQETRRNHYLRKALIDVCLAAVVTATLVELFEHGPLFVGDYVSVSQINPWSQFLNLFKPIDLASRNAGYGFRPYLLQWELGSSFVISAIFSYILGNPEYAKLVILLYLVVGALGMNHFLNRVLPYRINDQGWVQQATFRALISLLYALNPAVQQLLVKGYVGILATVAFLPILLLAYESLTRAVSKTEMITKGIPVALMAYLAATYTYPLLIVVMSVIVFEVSHSAFQPHEHRVKKGLGRLSSVAIFSFLLELPAVFIFSHESASGFLTSFYSGTNLAGFYYASSNPADIPSVITLTSSSWTSSYFHQIFPAWYYAFVAAILSLLAVTLIVNWFQSWNRLKLCSTLLFLASVLLSLGANFLPNLWLFENLPVFPEAFQFLPLVSFSLLTLFAIAFLEPGIRRVRSSLLSRLNDRRYGIGTVLLLLALCASVVPFAITSYSNLSPATIPAYDRSAYDWLASQPGDGRMLLIPPSYAVRYPFDSNSYGTPVDYWTISPPRPIIIDNGGSLRGLERMVPYALYGPNPRLLDYLLNSLAVRYVVLRTDALAAYDVPYYRNITTDYLSSNFPFLAKTQSFGPIAIFEDRHFDGVVTAYDYPIIVEGNVTSTTSLGQALAPGAPLVFTKDMTDQQLATLLSEYSSPILLPCNSLCSLSDSPPAGHIAVGVPENVTNTFAIENAGWKYLNVITGRDTTIVVANYTSFTDDFENSTFTRGSWAVTSGTWHETEGQYLTYNDSYQPYSLITSPTPGPLVIETEVNVVSGLGAGILLNTNSSQITERSYQVQLIPSWNAILLAEYSHGTGRWIQVVQTPLSHNTPYRLSISIVGSDFEVLLNGSPVISATIPDIPLNEVGLFGTQANVAFSGFRLMPYGRKEIAVNNPGINGDYWLSMPLRQGETFVSALNGTVHWAFMVNSVVNLSQLLNPRTSPVQYNYSSATSLRIFQDAPNRTFLVVRDRYTGGWILPRRTASYLAYGYALGIISSPQTDLSYDQTYSYTAEASIALIGVSFFFCIGRPAISMTRILKNRFRRSFH